MASVATPIANARQRLFERPAHLLYAICAVELAASVAVALGFGFRAASPTAFLPHLYSALCVACGPLLRRIEKRRLAAAFETVGFFYGQAFALVALLYPMTAIAAPFADDQLAAADRALGFDWPALAHQVGRYPALIRALWVSYFSFDWQGAIVLPALVLAGFVRRAWVTILSVNIALLLTMAIYPFFPAQGTFIHFGIAPQDYPGLTTNVAWQFGPAIHAIRDLDARIITRDLMVPFVSFPSFHAAAAALFAWAAWPVRKLRWPILLLNLAMAFSALIIGAHYLIDLIAGLIVAFVAIPLAAKVLEAVRSPD